MWKRFLLSSKAGTAKRILRSAYPVEDESS
jgi:hypothetical protein